MKLFLENILPKISSYSEKLDKLSILIDEPWVVSTNDQRFIKYIFRKDNTLLVSNSGSVVFGKWELLNRANSLMIASENSTSLYNHGFLDEAVLVLKIDGGMDYFVLLNQNKIPSLNLENYFKSKYFDEKAENQNSLIPKSRSKIQTDKGEIVIEFYTSPNTPSGGDFVFRDGVSAPNGKYKIGTMFYVHVVDGKIFKTSMF